MMCNQGMVSKKDGGSVRRKGRDISRVIGAHKLATFSPPPVADLYVIAFFSELTGGGVVRPIR